jgi:hypothetical protein
MMMVRTCVCLLSRMNHTQQVQAQSGWFRDVSRLKGSSKREHASCRSPRASHLDQSMGLDGRSDMSRDLSTTHALSRTLSFMSCGVSENMLSPTGGHSSHTSFFHPSASALEDQQLARSGSSSIPRTRIAGLPLFLHGDIVAMPHAATCTPPSAVPRPGALDYFGGSGRKHARMPVEATGSEQVRSIRTLC